LQDDVFLSGDDILDVAVLESTQPGRSSYVVLASGERISERSKLPTCSAR
jgi:hypothetical protein